MMKKLLPSTLRLFSELTVAQRALPQTGSNAEVGLDAHVRAGRPRPALCNNRRSAQRNEDLVIQPSAYASCGGPSQVSETSAIESVAQPLGCDARNVTRTFHLTSTVGFWSGCGGCLCKSLLVFSEQRRDSGSRPAQSPKPLYDLLRKMNSCVKRSVISLRSSSSLALASSSICGGTP